MTKTAWQVRQYLETTAKANGEGVGEVKRELVEEWGCAHDRQKTPDKPIRNKGTFLTLKR